MSGFNGSSPMNSIPKTTNNRNAPELRSRPCCLGKGEVVSVNEMGIRRRIQCRKGRLWITQTGLDCDIVLTSGQLFESDREGSLVIEALEPACFTHEEPISAKRRVVALAAESHTSDA